LLQGGCACGDAAPFDTAVGPDTGSADTGAGAGDGDAGD
jgi:hypothetical protein